MKKKRVNQKEEIKEDYPTYAPCSKAQWLMLNAPEDLILAGGSAGSGKSTMMLLRFLKHIHDPNYRGVVIRETSTQLTQAGGLVDEAKQIYERFGATWRMLPNIECRFPSGASIQFKVVARDEDLSNYQGLQASGVTWDEGAHQNLKRILYLFSRLRSKAKVHHSMMITCNPEYGSFLLPWVEPYLDAEGSPIRDDGTIWARPRWWCVYQNTIKTAETKEELLEQYPNVTPKTYRFIAANCEDNPVLLKRQPDYVSNLLNLPRVDMLRLYVGNWYAKPSVGSYFKREWCEMIDHLPNEPIVAACRGIDLAGTEVAEGTNPDWTASVLVIKYRSGYVIADAFRCRKLIHEVIHNFVRLDREDSEMGIRTTHILPCDTGAGGKIAHKYLSSDLVSQGLIVRPEIVSGTKSKLTRAQPFLSLASNGHVKVLKDHNWNDDFFNELEDFQDGNRNQKDDQWDAVATAFNFLIKNANSQLPTSMSIPVISKPSPIPTI